MKGLSERIDFIQSPDRAEDTLEKLFNTVYNMGIAVALWKAPDQENITLIADLSASINKVSFDHSIESGFVISPFINPDFNDTILIRPHIYFTTSENEININPGAAPGILQKFEESYAANENIEPFRFSSEKKDEAAQNPGKDFESIVNKAVGEIQKESFKKVVLSRSKIRKLNSGFNPLSFFLDLGKKYPTAFVSLVAHPSFGIWIGATPELLASVSKENIFKTISLAATKSAQSDMKLKDVVWNQKDIEEQALVSRYIINCFKSIRLREYEEEGPRTVQAGNLFHLRTDFTVNINEVPFPDLLIRMVRLLHPTSAVCGTPKEPALRFINEEEAFDRELFTGFLGPVNINNETSIFVNIRCCKIQADKVTLFAGAGITKDSAAEKELDETNHKMRTLESLFDNLQ